MTGAQMDTERLRFARLRWVGRVRSRVACTVREAELALEHLVRLGHDCYRLVSERVLAAATMTIIDDEEV